MNFNADGGLRSANNFHLIPHDPNETFLCVHCGDRFHRGAEARYHEADGYPCAVGKDVCTFCVPGHGCRGLSSSS